MTADELLNILLTLRERGLPLDKMDVAADDTDYIHRHYSYSGYELEYNGEGQPIVFAITKV